jgi:hypothetical protein
MEPEERSIRFRLIQKPYLYDEFQGALEVLAHDGPHWHGTAQHVSSTGDHLQGKNSEHVSSIRDVDIDTVIAVIESLSW